MRNQLVWATVAAIIVLILVFAPSTIEWITGAVHHVNEPHVCGNNISEDTEDCDGPDSIICGLCPKDSYGDRDPTCLANSCTSDCKCKTSYCGNFIVESGEECEFGNDTACHNYCNSETCTCEQFSPAVLGTAFSYTSLYANETINEEFSSTRLPVTQFALTMKSTALNVKITFIPNATITREFKQDYVIYQAFEIKLENLGDEQVANATLDFKVPNSWFQENNIDKFSVKLFRSIPSWQELPTEPTDESQDYTYYKAQSPGLSVFLIGGQEAATPVAPVYRADCGNGIVEPGEDSDNCCLDAGCQNDLTCVSNHCKLVTLCGNDICEQNETITNCPQDCTKQVLFSPTMLVVWAMLCIIIFLVALNLAKIKGPKKREPIMQQLASGFELRELK